MDKVFFSTIPTLIVGILGLIVLFGARQFAHWRIRRNVAKRDERIAEIKALSGGRRR